MKLTDYSTDCSEYEEKGMRILITGITGFVGSHLAEYILRMDEGDQIYGLRRWRSPKDNIASIYNKIYLLDGDLCDLSSLIRTLETVKPDIIFHLAAQSYVLTSFNSPIQTLWANVLGTTNLLEAVRITKSILLFTYVHRQKSMARLPRLMCRSKRHVPSNLHLPMPSVRLEKIWLPCNTGSHTG